MTAHPAVTAPPGVRPDRAERELPWPELVTTALLGTDRRPLPGTADLAPPVAVLRAAARHRVLALLAAPRPGKIEDESAPATPSATASRTAASPALDTAPPQDRPEAPPAADRLLVELLRTPDPDLVGCWLSGCVAAGRVVAAVHWTRLVRLAARITAYDRVLLGAALGPTGRWFLRQNPDWRRLAADAGAADPGQPADADAADPNQPSNADQPTPAPAPDTGQSLPAALTAQDVLADPEMIFAAPGPWSPELVSAAYAVLGGEGPVPPARSYPTRLGVALPAALYGSIARAGEYYVLAPDVTPGRRRTVRDRFVALELAAYARAAVDHAFAGDPTSTGVPRAEIPHV